MDVRVLSSGSKGNCYTLDDGRSSILIECGLPWHKIQTALAFRTYRIAACCISHEHKDHSRAAIDVLSSGIPVFASDGTARALGLPKFTYVGHDAGVARLSEEWFAQGFPVEHDAAEPWGFVIQNKGERVVYLTDTAYCRYRFPNVTHFMVEANYSAEVLDERIEAGVTDRAMKPRLLQTHMSIETCKQLLLANDLSKCQGIWLLHLSDNHSDADEFKRTIQEATGIPTYIA